MAKLSFFIQQVKDFIDSGQYASALKIIATLQSEHPSSALVLALKALVYERIAHSETLAICLNAKENFFNDIAVLPHVLDILQTVFLRLGEYELATRYYEYACENVSNSLALMTGLFYCYVRGLSFIDQLKISLKMYKIDRTHGCKFLFWSVLSIQSQVFCQLLTEHVDLHKLEEPETLLLHISVTEQHVKNDLVHEILSKLGRTLLVAEVGGQRTKGVKLLARVSDYEAAAEVLRQKFESCLDDWDCIINNLCQLLGNESKLCVAPVANQIAPIFHVCKLSQSSGYEAGLPMPMPDLLLAERRCVDESIELEEAVHEYYDRLGSSMEVSFQVLSKVDELRLIKDLKQDLTTLPAFQKAFDKSVDIHKVRLGRIDPGLKTGYHGTSIALKTDNFIILATDGKLTSRNFYNALKLRVDKVRDFGDMGVALSGDWTTTTKAINILSKCMRRFEDQNKRRPTISKFAELTRRNFFSRVRGTEIIFGGFDRLKDGKKEKYVPHISYVKGLQNVDIKGSFFCGGTGYSYANMVLSKVKVFPAMELNYALALVEKALVFASICDGCSGGLASIHVIKLGKIQKMPREDIHSTLWNRHKEWLECHIGLPH